MILSASLLALWLLPLTSGSLLGGDFQSRADAVSNILTDYLCDLMRTFGETHRRVQQQATFRMDVLDKMATIYAIDDRRVPWMLDMCRSLVDENILWTHRQQQLAMQHVLNETRVAEHSIRYHIGYYIHLDGLFPDALADWSGSFERTTRDLTTLGWKSNNETVAYHEDSFGRLLRLNRRMLSGNSAVNCTSVSRNTECDAGSISDSRTKKYRSTYAGTWRTLVRNAAAELQSTHDKFGALLQSYASQVTDVGKVIAKRLRKLNVINEKCFCS